MEVYLYRPSTFCVLFDTPQSAPFYDAFSPIVPQSCACKAEIWTVLSSSSSSGVWDWRWNQQTHSLQTKFNSPKADYQSSVRCFFSHSWSLCKKLILEVLEKVSELFFWGGGGDTFRLLFKYVRVWSLNFLFAIPQTYRGRSQAIGTTNSVAKLFPQSVDTFSCCSHSCHVVFVGVLWMPVRTVDTAVICSTHISEVVVFLKKTVTVILSVPTLHHKVILEPRRSASFTAFVSAFVACSVCCELPHICKWNQRLV